MSIEAQIARARELLGRGGILQLPPTAEGVARETTLPSLLYVCWALGLTPYWSAHAV